MITDNSNQEVNEGGRLFLSERIDRFFYKKGDLITVTNQCKNCCFNENKPLSCVKYTRIPNGTRSGKIKCPYKTIKV